MNKVRVRFDLIDGSQHADGFTCEGNLLEMDDIKMLTFKDRDQFDNTVNMDPTHITTIREGRFKEVLNFKLDEQADGYMDALGEEVKFKVNTLEMSYNNVQLLVKYNLAREGAKNPYTLKIKYTKI